jgi:hypothetical protein
LHDTWAPDPLKAIWYKVWHRTDKRATKQNKTDENHAM